MESDDELGDDIFLPTEFDRLRAQVNDYRRRLAIATAKEAQLKRQLIEENLSFVTISYYTKLIQDPTQLMDAELTDLQRKVFEKFIRRAEGCCIRECITYHRLGGRTVFDLNNVGGQPLECIRLDTFYNQAYKEAYYIIYNREELQRQRTQLQALALEEGLSEHTTNRKISKKIKAYRHPPVIIQHTIPSFLAIDVLKEELLPHNMDAFLRIVHQRLQAYVVRREIINDLAIAMSERRRRNTILRNYVYAEYTKPGTPIRIIHQNRALDKLQLEFTPPLAAIYDTRPNEKEPLKLFIDMVYSDPASSYPTEVSITKVSPQQSQDNNVLISRLTDEERDFIINLENELKVRRLNHALVDILDFTTEESSGDNKNEMVIDQ